MELQTTGAHTHRARFESCAEQALSRFVSTKHHRRRHGLHGSCSRPSVCLTFCPLSNLSVHLRGQPVLQGGQEEGQEVLRGGGDHLGRLQ